MSKGNLEEVIGLANDRDMRVAGEAWFRYHTIVERIACNHGFGVAVGAGVFAALSPNNDYLGNIRDTSRMLQAARNGSAIDDFPVSTYGANKRKAWRIAKGENPLDLIIAPKTRNFFLNVLDPLDTHAVTVDGHIVNAWANQRIPLNSAKMKGFSKLYDQVAETIRQIGAERQMIPNVIQGLIWYCHKRRHGILYSHQRSFWADDFILAGLGFEPEW